MQEPAAIHTSGTDRQEQDSASNKSLDAVPTPLKKGCDQLSSGDEQPEKGIWTDAINTPTTALTEFSSNELTQALQDKLAKHELTQQERDELPASVLVDPVPQDDPRGDKNRASTTLAIEDADDVRRFLEGAQGHTERVPAKFCGSGCCKLSKTRLPSNPALPILQPDNAAFRSLNLKLGHLSLESELTDILQLDAPTASIHESSNPRLSTSYYPSYNAHPPNFVQPHPPHDVYSAPLINARELTRPGALKRTYHFDLDVTNYPTEDGNVDFKVGGAIGVCAPNKPEDVEWIFNKTGVLRHLRDKPIELRTTGGRWPTVWGEEEPRSLHSTRREILTWCSDIQSGPPSKQLIRLLADHAADQHEKKILLYLCSDEGQAAFCELRTRSHISLIQLLTAFPSSRPPFEHLISHLTQLMPRFYSLSQDPHIQCEKRSHTKHRIIEIAVTVHHTPEFDGSVRTGVGSGFLERLAAQCIDVQAEGIDPSTLGLRVPMFRGLMANPLAKEFVHDGPMLLIGAGVGIAPFRGFVQRRLQSANCVNRVWLLQGVRDSLADELYNGEWGLDPSIDAHERVRRVVESRVGMGAYVQDEVKNQKDLVWDIINSLDGRVFVCGAGELGDGVREALEQVAQWKGGLDKGAAEEFWEQKKRDGQLVMEVW